MTRLAPYSVTFLPGITTTEVAALLGHLSATYLHPIVVHDRRTP